MTWDFSTIAYGSERMARDCCSEECELCTEETGDGAWTDKKSRGTIAGKRAGDMSEWAGGEAIASAITSERDVWPLSLAETRKYGAVVMTQRLAAAARATERAGRSAVVSTCQVGGGVDSRAW